MPEMGPENKQYVKFEAPEKLSPAPPLTEEVTLLSTFKVLAEHGKEFSAELQKTYKNDMATLLVGLPSLLPGVSNAEGAGVAALERDAAKAGVAAAEQAAASAGNKDVIAKLITRAVPEVAGMHPYSHLPDSLVKGAGAIEAVFGVPALGALTVPELALNMVDRGKAMWKFGKNALPPVETYMRQQLAKLRSPQVSAAAAAFAA